MHLSLPQLIFYTLDFFQRHFSHLSHYSTGGQPFDSMRQFFSHLIQMRHTNIHFFSVL